MSPARTVGHPSREGRCVGVVDVERDVDTAGHHLRVLPRRAPLGGELDSSDERPAMWTHHIDSVRSSAARQDRTKGSWWGARSAHQNRRISRGRCERRKDPGRLPQVAQVFDDLTARAPAGSVQQAELLAPAASMWSLTGYQANSASLARITLKRSEPTPNSPENQREDRPRRSRAEVVREPLHPLARRVQARRGALVHRRQRRNTGRESVFGGHDRDVHAQ